jgi:hypothetical protein
MRLTRTLARFNVLFNTELKQYSFQNINRSGESDINTIRSNIYPLSGNCDNNMVCHILQHHLPESSHYNLNYLIFSYGINYCNDGYFVEDFQKLNNVDREKVIESIIKRNDIRRKNIEENKFNLKNSGHVKLLKTCEIQLENILKINEQELDKLKLKLKLK